LDTSSKPEENSVNVTITIETDPDRKSAVCADVINALPEWFGIESAREHYIKAVRKLYFLTVESAGRAIGFCAVKVHEGINAELYVLGILKAFHGQGIGTQMVDRVAEYCGEKSIPYMSVKTLSPRHSDPNYARTRQFYERVGFKAFEEFPDLWGKENPCLLMIRDVL
jgi:ribosomal protein S18 acetylase RimI-like enzyme